MPFVFEEGDDVDSAATVCADEARLLQQDGELWDDARMDNLRTKRAARLGSGHRLTMQAARPPAAPKNHLVLVLARPGFSHNRASIRQDAWIRWGKGGL